MAVGDVVSSMSVVSSGGFMSIIPGSGQHWVIHNLYHGNDVCLQLYNGTNPMSFTSIAGANVETNLQFHCTEAIYLRVQSVADSAWMGFDGVQTK